MQQRFVADTEETAHLDKLHAAAETCHRHRQEAHLGRGGAQPLEQVWEEGGIPLQLVQDFHVIEQHHTLQSSKCLVIQHLQCSSRLQQSSLKQAYQHLHKYGITHQY